MSGPLMGGSGAGPTTGPASLRAGVTLVELMIALSLFSIILATSLNFYRQQGDAFTAGNTRMTVMQNLRYGVNSVEQNLQTAGSGVPTRQPVLIYAGPRLVAFNADYATNRQNDPFAVYYDRRLPDAAASALTPDRRITLPNTSFAYPDSAYAVAGGNSPAETILFFFEPDTTTARPDDWALYRQTNDLAPEIVARRLLKNGRDFFAYYTLGGDATGSPIREVPAAELPLVHSAPLHGSVADTGAAARIDSIRAVRVSYAATSGSLGGKESVREISRLVRIPNAGLDTHRTCGNSPLLGSALMATPVAPSGSERGHIALQWTRATDEVSGEQDVLRYVLWRRVGDAGPWGDPLVSVSPGSSTYLYRDYSAEEGVEYSYALAAQDCTPQYSALATTGALRWTAP